MRRHAHATSKARRPRSRLVLLAVTAALGLALAGGIGAMARSGGADAGSSGASDPAATGHAVDQTAVVAGDVADPPTRSPAASPSAATASPSPSPDGGAGLTAADRRAGVLSSTFPQRGSGRLLTVPGSHRAPGTGKVWTVRVQVEQGLDIDKQAFADFVLDTLNDPRSWGHGGRLTFARTDGAADVRVVLASPDTSARMCLPQRTFGKLSCRTGDAAVLTVYRWVRAIPGYGTDRDGYRHYLVNHEVGHALGHGHVMCPRPGAVAPVMMQQSKGLLGCLPNAWPFP